MSGRTPSFIVVGLVIIMFLLGVFYMSCSSKNTEMRLSLEQFEERIRSLTIKNSDSEKTVETISARKRELEEEKLNIQKQMEKKDSEINDLNTRFNEKMTELQGLKSDKSALEQQLNEYKSMSETLASKDALIEQLQQQLANQKQLGTDALARLKHENQALRDNIPPQDNQQQPNSFPIPPQRYRPFPTNNQTRRSISSLFQGPINQLNNLTKEVKPEFVAAALDVKDKVLNVFGTNTDTNPSNEQQQQQPGAGQNVPPPPLANHEQQLDRVEAGQVAPHADNQLNENNQQGDNSPYQQRLQRSLNHSLSDHENDDEEELDGDNLQENAIPHNNQENNDNVHHHDGDNVPPPSRVKGRSFRKVYREQFQNNQENNLHEEKLDNGGEIDDEHNHNEEGQEIPKPNVL